jgi:hypothetical protein
MNVSLHTAYLAGYLTLLAAEVAQFVQCLGRGWDCVARQDAHPMTYPVYTHLIFPSKAEVKNSWNYTSTPPYVFLAWYLIKHRESFTLYTLLIIDKLCYIPGCEKWLLISGSRVQSRVTSCEIRGTYAAADISSSLFGFPC